MRYERRKTNIVIHMLFPLSFLNIFFTIFNDADSHFFIAVSNKIVQTHCGTPIVRIEAQCRHDKFISHGTLHSFLFVLQYVFQISVCIPCCILYHSLPYISLMFLRLLRQRHPLQKKPRRLRTLLVWRMQHRLLRPNTLSTWQVCFFQRGFPFLLLFCR